MKHGHHVGHPGPSASHDRPATIRDLPPHLLANRVAAHLSAADAARLMQAAGKDHRGELKHVMNTKKTEIEREAAPIVDAVKRIMRAGVGTKSTLRGWRGKIFNVYVRNGQNDPQFQGYIDLVGSDTVTRLDIGRLPYHFLTSPNFAELKTFAKGTYPGVHADYDSRITETPTEIRMLLLEFARQLTGKKVVTTWVKDVRKWYAFGRGSARTDPSARDHPREVRLLEDKLKANPGALVVLLTGHLKK